MVKIDFVEGRVRVTIPLDSQFQANLDTVKRVGGGRYKADARLGKHHHFPMMRLPKLLEAFPQAWLGHNLAGFIERTKKAQAIKSLKDAEQPVGIMIPLRPLQRVAVKFLSLYGRAILASDIGVGKCVLPQTHIVTNFGFLTAEQIWEKFHGEEFPVDGGIASSPNCDLKMVSEENHVMVWRSVTTIYRQLIAEPIKDIEIQDGSVVSTTLSHRVKAADETWENRPEVGTWLLGARNMPEPEKPFELSDDAVTVIAWQITEGHEQGNGANISQKDRTVLEDLYERVVRLGVEKGFTLTKLYIRNGDARHCPDLRIASNDYQKWLVGMGYQWGANSAKKRLPPQFINLSHKNLRLLLSHMFSAEGSVTNRDGHIEFISASRWLVLFVAVALRRFGILAVVKRHKVWGQGVYHRLNLTGIDSRLFVARVGFSISSKQLKAKSVHTTIEEGVSIRRSVPYRERLTSLADNLGIRRDFLGIKGQGRLISEKQITDKVVPGLRSLLGGRSENEADIRIKEMLGHLESNLHRDTKVVEVIRAATRHYSGIVYDFEIEETHNFVCENMICHNTFCGIGWARGRAGLHKGKHGTLVVTKNAGKYAYQAEILRAVPGARVVVIEGRDGWFPTPGSTDWVIMNYELLAYRVEQIEAFGFESCIFSECHKLKGAKAPRQKADGTMAAGGTQRGGAGLEIGEFIPNILMETASLTPNRNGELFPLLQILGYVTEDDYYAWHVHFTGSTKVRPDGTIENFPAQKIKVNRRGLLRWDFSGSSFSDELHESIAPFTFAVTKKEALPELPDQYFTPTPVDITNMADYREATRHFLQWLQEEKGVEAVAKAKKALAIVKMGVLLQLAAKGVVQAIVETLDSYADAKEKVVVFSSYKGPLADVEAKFPGLCVRITGDESAAEKDAAIQEFQRDPAKLFCLCTTEAGGESATLTAASTALFMSLPWSPETFRQGWGRVHRWGQKNKVQVIVMIGRQTIMVDIVEMLYGKALDVNRVLTGKDRSPNSDALRKILAHVSPGVAQGLF